MRLISLLYILCVALIISSCAQKVEKREESPAPAPVPEITIKSEIISKADRSKAFEKSTASSEAATSTTHAAPSSSGLKAGFSDDNSQYGAYIDFLTKNKQAIQIPFNVNERIIIKVLDIDNNSLPDAIVEISANGKTLMKGKTYANGELLFFPSEYPEIKKFDITITHAQKTIKGTINRDGKRTQEFQLNAKRGSLSNVPVDILFILDTTGSMTEEITSLKDTLLIIHANITAMSQKPDVRFGMVMYKDRGDEYITNKVDFTADPEQFLKAIKNVKANGGGDTPEDMQEALRVTIEDMQWRENGVRLVYVITDASTHTDYGQKYTLLTASQRAREKGIKIHSIGTGGLDLDGEIGLRQIAQYTMGKYIFLTYGERGDSEGGAPGSVSHHVGGNFTTDKLETVIIRFTKDEIQEYSLAKIEESEDYFTATDSGKDNAAVLDELFRKVVDQLISYSSLKITSDTAVAVVPFETTDKTVEKNAKYFTDQMQFAVSKYPNWKPIERVDVDKILKEIKFNLSGLVDEESAMKIGELSGADILITGTLYKKEDNFELYIKMISTKSGEILSVSKSYIDLKLGVKAGKD